MYDDITIVNTSIMSYQKSRDALGLLSSLLSIYDGKEQDPATNMAFLEGFKLVACSEPQAVLPHIRKMPFGWQMEIKLSIAMTIIGNHNYIFWFAFDQILDRKGIDFLICDKNIQVKFGNHSNKIKHYCVAWEIPEHTIGHKEIFDFLEEISGMDLRTRVPYESCLLIDKLMRY